MASAWRPMVTRHQATTEALAKERLEAAAEEQATAAKALASLQVQMNALKVRSQTQAQLIRASEGKLSEELGRREVDHDGRVAAALAEVRMAAAAEQEKQAAQHEVALEDLRASLYVERAKDLKSCNDLCVGIKSHGHQMDIKWTSNGIVSNRIELSPE